MKNKEQLEAYLAEGNELAQALVRHVMAEEIKSALIDIPVVIDDVRYLVTIAHRGPNT